MWAIGAKLYYVLVKYFCIIYLGNQLFCREDNVSHAIQLYY